jgi:hypothetical protein
MSWRRRAWPWAGVIVGVVVVLVLALVLVVQPRRRDAARDQAARAAADALAAAWRDGNLEEAPVADRSAALAGYDKLVADLDGVRPERVEVTSVMRSEDEALATLQVIWPFAGVGPTPRRCPLLATSTAPTGARGPQCSIPRSCTPTWPRAID